ncbi:putative SEC14-phosphatidylinositol/phosphatidylcholine transfer protein [Neocallimastix californiae]|uniref:Putative SEC14-phosphatidylinositol/phosphatidylcholine transfer protein n=1 Tax=Neocallimastix californiae TaxID=1754190 RepID=A0A1Y2E5E5_9FUNG|nr:putative SEC14-phosphatidylinositol/phosphatidylcholine transfer protein [Neocallimastix californiae]|eukprot:ORY66770.1 putative SEC14-phosphatidylinositol/phosphatidylcholine transfer protein [Neocallimastix californiae]
MAEEAKVTIPEPKPGSLANLSEEQKKKLDEFKAMLKEKNEFREEEHNDHLLLRFLRARDFDLTKTYEMFSNCQKWRESINIDELCTSFEFPEEEEVQKLYPRFYHKVDKFGRPIYIEQLGPLDLKKLFNVTTEEKMINHHVYEYEKLIHKRFPACSNRAGYHIETSCTIMDLKKVGLFQFAKAFSFIKKMLGQMFIINAPLLFTSTWKLITPLLDPVTVKKIKILGGKYESEIFKVIDPENFPKFLGGTCECPECNGGCARADQDHGFRIKFPKI